MKTTETTSALLTLGEVLRAATVAERADIRWYLTDLGKTWLDESALCAADNMFAEAAGYTRPEHASAVRRLAVRCVEIATMEKLLSYVEKLASGEEGSCEDEQHKDDL